MIDLRAGFAMAAARLAAWVRLVFMWPTHRFIKLAPGVYVQAERGTSNADIAALLAAHLKTLKGK